MLLLRQAGLWRVLFESGSLLVLRRRPASPPAEEEG